MKRLFITVISLLPLCVYAATSCDLKSFHLRPWKSGNYEKYVGGKKAIRIEVNNENSTHPENTYPEPPLLVSNARTGKSCSIDGGIWQNDKMWLSKDGGTLALYSYSGSSALLTLYDSATCQAKSKPIDISGKWRIAGNEIIYHGVCGDGFCYGTGCTCVPASIHKLDSSCSPDFLPAASAKLTKKNFGVQFSSPSIIDWPMTPQANIVRAL